MDSQTGRALRQAFGGLHRLGIAAVLGHSRSPFFGLEVAGIPFNNPSTPPPRFCCFEFSVASDYGVIFTRLTPLITFRDAVVFAPRFALLIPPVSSSCWSVCALYALKSVSVTFCDGTEISWFVDGL
jgi:hypothetical protein